MRFAIYSRKSVLTGRGESIENQVELCRSYLAAHYPGVRPEEVAVYEDEGFSGKDFQRPQFRRMLEDIRRARPEALVCYRLDRVSRSVGDFADLIRRLEGWGVAFLCIREKFDTSTPMGKAMMYIASVFAQLERETIAQRVRDNYYRRAALGTWPGGPAPFGFDNGRAAGRDGRRAPALVPNGRGELVRRIFAEYAGEGTSLSGLAKKLSREGIPGPKRAVWDSVSLSRLLHNPAYVKADEQVRLYYLGQGVTVSDPAEHFDGQHGLLLVGRRETDSRRRTDAGSQVLSVLNSPGLVEAELFLRCQEKLRKNRQLGRSGQGKHTWLSGLLKCAECGYSISVTENGGRRYLHCSGRYNLAHCRSAIRVDLAELEERVQGDISKLLADCPKPRAESGESRYAASMTKLDRQAERLTDAFAQSESMPADYLRRALGKIQRQRQTLQQERDRAQRRGEETREMEFAALTFAEKKAVAAQLIACIRLAGDTVEIRWAV